MRLKLDENLGKSPADALRLAGHDVTTVPQQGLCGIEDSKLIKICSNESRCLVSLDIEFGNPILFKPVEYHGIVVLRLPRRPGAQDLLDVISTFIAGLARENVVGKL